MSHDFVPFLRPERFAEIPSDQKDLMLAMALARIAALERLAFYDPLTKLPNRSTIISELEQRQENGKMTGLVFCDVDGFKAVNDTYGHSAGDMLLQKIAQKFETIIRKPDASNDSQNEAERPSLDLVAHERKFGATNPDFTARLAGDEFIFIIDLTHSESPGDDLLTFTDRLRAECNEWTSSEQIRDYQIGISLGLVLCTPGAPVSQLLAEADAAMYVDKAIRKGRLEQ